LRLQKLFSVVSTLFKLILV